MIEEMIYFLLNLKLILGWCIVLFGLFFMCSAVVGMLRFDGLLNKIHAAGVADSCGIIIFLIGMALLQNDILTALKIISLAAFILATGPFATYAVGNSFIKKSKSEHVE